ncbi:protein NRT1/ PTR FAMILY 6.2-like [Telopea speciosissima]|uniref:protein NRT1/ PTR FAMILY 6.2-like n=1 Tax=Telopea speciosissima TaxID=54955 RepID=UPI001CC5F7D9|nr:protein NRT1/ PTR FAMILY 6.2-like [Telopea speciosissima]
MALGQGGIKANVSGFGTDQFDENDKKEKSKMGYVFSRFYFFISLGSLLSVTVEIYVQDNVSRSWGYGLCCFAFFFVTVFYLLRTRKYRYKKCVGNPIVQVLNVLVAALRKSKLKCPTNVDTLYNDSIDDSTAPRIRHTDQLRWLDKAAIIDENNYGTNGSVLTFSVEQANTLERSIGNFLIPAGSFNVLYIAGILIGAAFYDRVIIPLMKTWKGKHGFTYLQRIAIGMVFSILAMAVASIVETRRLAARLSCAYQMSTGIFLLIVGLGFLLAPSWCPQSTSFTNLIFFILGAIWYVKTMKNSSQIESIITSSEEEEKHAIQKKGTLTASLQRKIMNDM